MWEEADVFSPEGAQKLREDAGLPVKKDPKTQLPETFCVLMPPPNANAPLHCGHATYAIQDLMTRIMRMKGYKSLYLPGADHAGFETQVVYERLLKKQGKSRFDFDRETLYNDILKFVEENSGVAINQLKKLGMSADWSRNTFMLDDFVVKTVYDTFEKMHRDGLIYRDMYLVNYSPHHGTTFSNLETEHKETVSPLYYVKYKIADSGEESGRADSKKYITVATVRPETIYADVAVAVNPEDSRYKNLVGKTVVNPLNDREMEIISDSYVDTEFGTGALKITPGHDFNDYEIGKKHNLEMISVIDLEGKMTQDAPEVAGLSTTEARGKVADLLNEKDAIDKIDKEYTHNLVVDYKDNLPIEPMLLPNWFVKMDGWTEAAVAAIRKEEVKFNHPRWKEEMLRWLENIHDWPISRQTVFGIKIPIWYKVDGDADLFVVFLDEKGDPHEGDLRKFLAQEEFNLEDIKSGLQRVIAPADAEYEVSVECPGENYIQETDTFDTWFSSGQWPFTTLRYPNGDDFKTFFPTTFMDSMWDILFFWIARMIMFSLYLTKDDEVGGKVPFEQVYIHGRINDEHGQKMSKSKGNVIDPIEFIEEYGADALRMGLLVGGNTAAGSTSFSEDKVRGYRNFANKIWNMARFMNLMIERYEDESGSKVPFFDGEVEARATAKDKEMLEGLGALIDSVETNLKKYRFQDMGDEIYHFMWHTLADEYIEHVKTRDDKDVALSVLGHAFANCLKLLHPFMPFVTEEIWQNIRKSENESGMLAMSDWPN